MNFRNHGLRFSPALLLTLLLAGSLIPLAADPVPSVVLIRSTPNPVVHGQKVSLAAGVNATVSEWPGGTITLTDTCSNGGAPITSVLGSFTLGSGTSATPGDGSMVVFSFPCLGPNHIVASYSGDANYLPGTSQPLIETVLSSFTPTSTTIGASSNPAAAGNSVSFTAVLAYNFVQNSHATGTVTFTDTKTSQVLGTGAVITAGGAKQETTYAAITASLAPGTYSIEAAYSGDNIYASSTSPILNEVVQGSNPDPTTTGLTASANEITEGAPVKLTALVKSSSGIPAGAVSFYNGASLLATLSLDAAGQAVLTTSSLAVGTHSITASYSGDVTFAKSSSAIVTITVQPPAHAATSTVLTSSANPATAGASIALVAKVTSASAGTPTGTVTFVNDSTTPSTVLGTSALLNGVASLNRAFAAGTYKLAANYSGDTDFAASTGTLSEVVNPPALSPTKTAITSSANPSVYGQTVTFAAAVTGSKGVPTGEVEFRLGATSAAVKLDSNGKAVLTTSALATGSMNISAVYLGDTVNAGSTSPVLGQTIDHASTTATLTSSSNPSYLGAPVFFQTFITAAAPGSGTLTGKVWFELDGSTVLCSWNSLHVYKAGCTTSALKPGVHTITLNYSGDANFLSTAKSLKQTVLGYVPVQTLSMTRTPFVYNSATRLFAATGTVTNLGKQAVPGPIQVVFTQLPAGITLVNAAGAFKGAPYITLPAALSPGRSASFAIVISDPTRTKYLDVMQFYSGQFQ